MAAARKQTASSPVSTSTAEPDATPEPPKPTERVHRGRDRTKPNMVVIDGVRYRPEGVEQAKRRAARNKSRTPRNK